LFPRADTCVENDARNEAETQIREAAKYFFMQMFYTVKKKKEKNARPYFKVEIWIATQEEKIMQAKVYILLKKITMKNVR